MQLYFIRHGQSENNRLWAETGSSAGRSADPDLTPVGRQQAEILAQFLNRPAPSVEVDPLNRQNVAGFGLTHLYTSLMVRAVATGNIIARALGLPLVAWEDVHETGGIYKKDPETGERVGQPGSDRAFFETHYPDLVLPEDLGEAGWWNRPFEKRAQRYPRARRFVGDLMARHGDTQDRVAVVSHGGFFRYMLAELLQMPGLKGYGFIMNNTAFTRIDFGDEMVLVYMNRVDHLPRELVT